MFTSGDFDVERFRYWQGQKLRSRDFRDEARISAELHWWHNRALHQVYGVRSGMKVTTINNGGSIEGVKVDCGVAYDCYGRELLIQTARVLPLPERSDATGRVILVARYKSTSAYERKTPGSCEVAEEAELVWFQARRVDVADGVPLVQLDFESTVKLEVFPDDANLSATLRKKIHYDRREKVLVFTGVMSVAEQKELSSLSSTNESFVAAIGELFEKSQQVPVPDVEFRPVSRALARPRVGRGQTVAGDTPWEPWLRNAPLLKPTLALLPPFRALQSIPIGMQVTVNTSAAGFTETPCYFAWIEGTLWDKVTVTFVPIPFVHIDRESIDSFRFRLWMPGMNILTGKGIRSANSNFSQEFINYARGHGLHVCWIGIQERQTAGDECASVTPLKGKTNHED